MSWEEFECILQDMGEKRAAGIAFRQGTLEIMVSLPEQYVTSNTSPTFTNIPLTQIIPATVERAWQVGSV